MRAPTLPVVGVVVLVGGLAVSGLLAGPAPAPAAVQAPAGTPPITVFKSPTCGCCTAWEDHLRAHGFTVDSRPREDMAAVKARAGVPDEAASCHTAVIDGYVVEGHVPAPVILDLLAERPDALGLAVPGMPVGSPGMEDPGGRVDRYDVALLRADGASSVYRSL